MAQHDDREQARRVREAQKLDAVIEADINKAVAQLSQRREGRRFLWWLLQIGKIGINPATNNALSTQFNCGELNVGLQVQARIISVDPAIYVRMQQENQSEHEAFQAGLDDSGRSAFSTAGEPGSYDDAASDD